MRVFISDPVIHGKEVHMQPKPRDSWDENRKRAYIAGTDDNLFVEAGAGAGKTTRLSRRILGQLDKGVSPDRFIVITYTSEAAGELRTKLVKQLKRQIPSAEPEEKKRLKTLLAQLPRFPIGTITDFAEKICARYGGDAEPGQQNAPEQALRLIKDNPQALQSLRQKCERIFVDEFQDTDRTQKELIWLIAQDGSGRLRDNALFVIGDSKQCIYGNERLQIHDFHAFRRQMLQTGNAHWIRLKDNFRADAELVSWINASFHPQFPHYFDMRSVPPGDERERSFPLSGVFRSSDGDIPALIRRLMVKADGITPDHFLIVAPSAEDAAAYGELLARNGIPATGSQREYDRRSGAVQVMDPYRAKSLNSEIVLIPDAGRKPQSHIRQWIPVEYVAATRAKHVMVFVPSERPQWFDETTYRLSGLDVV